jgi:hypothetical protein
MMLKRLAQSDRTVPVAQIEVTIGDLGAFFTKKHYPIGKPSLGPHT